MKQDISMELGGGNAARSPTAAAFRPLYRIAAEEEPATERSILGPVARPGGSLCLLRSPGDERSERIRALRTELLLRREDNSTAATVALLSPGPREGRSLLAAELAVGFAQLGRPTLLVDADLRHPTQHLLFRTDNREGLSQAIANASAPRLHPVEGVTQLYLLSSGPLPVNPLELLLQPRFAELVEQWRERFDYVLFDSPPIRTYSDGLALAAIAGDVLTLARAPGTPYQEMHTLLGRLSATQARVVGAVLNHF